MKIDFFLVGPPKCGTTTIYHWLKTNKAVFLPSLKEPHYFLFNDNNLEFTGPGDNERLERMVITDKGTYFALYGDISGNQICGDCSTMYFYSDKAIREISLHNPEAKIIIVLRDPIERAFSHYMHMVRDGYENGINPIESFNKSADRINKGYMPFWDYFSAGNYSDWVPKWKNEFKNLLILDHKLLRNKPNVVMKRIALFLGVPNDFEVNDEQYNTSGIPLSPKLNQILKQQTNVHKVLSKLIPDSKRKSIKNKILQFNNRPKKMSAFPGFKSHVAKVHKSDIQFYNSIDS